MKIHLGGVPEYFNLPILLAKDKGLFSTADIELHWQEVPEGTGAMVQQLSTGQLDAAIILTEGAIKAVYEGCPAKILQTYVQSPLGWGVHIPASSTITQIQQVWDRPFAISRPGSGSHLMALHMAMQHGTDPHSLEFVQVNNLAGARQAFQKGTAEVFMWEQYTTKPLVDAGEFKRIHLHPTPWPCFVVAASSHFLQKHPDRVSDFQQQVVKAVEYALSLENLPQLIVERYGLKPKDVAAFLPKVAWAKEVGQPKQATSAVMEVFNMAKVLKAQKGQTDFFWE